MPVTKTISLSICVVLVLLCACTTIAPNEPSVLVLPGTGKNFEQFRADNDTCKQFAREQVAGRTPDSVAAESGVRSAAVGTVLGAAAGAAINGRRDAGVGAGSGLALGGLAGASTAETAASRLQQHFDFGYEQCMYAKGHRIPVAGAGLMDDFFQGRQGRYIAPPPPAPPAQ